MIDYPDIPALVHLPFFFPFPFSLFVPTRRPEDKNERIKMERNDCSILSRHAATGSHWHAARNLAGR